MNVEIHLSVFLCMRCDCVHEKKSALEAQPVRG